MAFADIEGIEVIRRNNFITADVTEGPMRWERARLNAIAKPHTQAAKLYLGRREVAVRVVAAVPGARSDVAYVYINEWGQGRRYHSARRRYYCSVECAAMDLQLQNVAEANIVQALDYVTWNGQATINETDYGRTRLERVWRGTHERNAKCKVCAEAISTKPKSNGGAIAQQFVDDFVNATAPTEKPKYVLIDGRFVALARVRVVELTDEEWRILDAYSTQELRRKYADDYGYSLAEQV
jgi:hypothetical protein